MKILRRGHKVHVIGMRNRTIRLCRRLGLVLLVIALGTNRCSGQDVVGVLSSDLKPYLDAFNGFQSVYDKPVLRIDLKDGAPAVPQGVRVVVAFGGKAAMQPYPEGVMLVYCLAPGLDLGARARGDNVVHVAMLPAAHEVLARLKLLQPELSHLGVFWSSEAQAPYVNALGGAAQSLDVILMVQRASSMDDLPEGLRRMLREGVDAVWLPPDPALITAQSFDILRTFSASNNVPLYVPSGGLVDKGAVASVACSFDEVGRTAGQVVRRVLSGEHVPSVVYPERVAFRVNAAAAMDAGLKIDRAVLERGGGEVR